MITVLFFLYVDSHSSFGDVVGKETNFKLKFARLTTQYRSKLVEWMNNPTGNYGDCFQGFAVENIFKEKGILASELVLVNRDELDTYKGEKVIVVMQGWFGIDTPLIWSENITPLFFGFHLQKNAQELFLRSGALERMKKMENAIGCRDRETMRYLKSQGVNAYFSGCLTLTLPKREKRPQHERVFIANLQDGFLKKIPVWLRKNALMVSQTHQFGSADISETEYIRFETKARKMLEHYRTEARLVITSKIHVAMPCVAMGIPVVFLFHNKRNSRIDVLQGIIRVYTLKDINKVDWNPPEPDIEILKDLIRENIFGRIEEMKVKADNS